MKHSSLFTRAASGGPERPATFSAGSGSMSRPIHSSRGRLRAHQQSFVSSSVHQDSLADFATIDGNMDETQPSLLLADEELRQSAERHAKRVRQLQAREIRQRTIINEEEPQQFEKIVALHMAYAAIAATCVNLQASRAAARQHDAAQSQLWSCQLLADAVRDVVQGERVSRRGVMHAEAAVRATLSQMRGAEARGLELHDGAFRLVHAERVRRAFLLREEARGVEALQIPHFISLPCVTSASERSGICATTARGMREVDKMDLMAEERCPFRCAADCPYMPPRTRHLGKLWAGAGEGAAGQTNRPALPADAVQRHGVSEVGRQRVRYAMAKEHLRETPTFLPSLRV